MNPKVSVITPFYNNEDYLKESLLSILNQSYKNFELIVVDDGSTDNSLKIAKELYQPKMRVLINKHNEGFNISRNRALLAAKGEFVAVHDGDDISLPDRLEKQVEFLDKNPQVTVVGSWAIKINSNGKTIGTMCYPALNMIDAIKSITRLKLNPIIDPTSMYRRSEVIKLGGYSAAYKVSADFDLWCRLIQHNKIVANIPELLVKYRDNSLGLTKTKKEIMDKNADNIIASFRARNCISPVLRPDYFDQDCFVEYKGD